MDKVIKSQPLNEVPIMTNTSGMNLVVEREGKVYRAPFKEEHLTPYIEKDDVFLFRDTVSEEQGTNKILGVEFGDMLKCVVDPDNYPIYTQRLDNSVDYSVLPLELGKIDETDGDWLEYDYADPYTRCSIYIPITLSKEYRFECPTGQIMNVRIMLCDSNKRIINTKWNEGLRNYKTVALSKPFSTTEPAAKYMMLDIKGCGSTDIELRIDTKLDPLKEYFTINKFKLADFHELSIGDTIRGLTKQVQINHDSPRAKSTMFTIKAPFSRSLDSTLRLLNAGLKTSQLVDLRSVRDDEEASTRGRCELGIRSFGDKTPVPEFKLGFANSINEDIIYKFSIDPDAMPIRLTSKGIQFRNNNYSNNSPVSKELLTINFHELNTKINNMYISMRAHSLLVDQIDPGEIELVNINADHIDYNNEKYPTVSNALDYLLENNISYDLSEIKTDISNLHTACSALDKQSIILEKSMLTKLADLDTKVNGYTAAIADSTAASNAAKASAETSAAKVAEIYPKATENAKDIANLKNDVTTMNINLSSKDKEIEEVVLSLKNNPYKISNQMITYINPDVIGIEANYRAICTCFYNTTKETTGKATVTFSISSTEACLGKFKLVLDGKMIGIECKQTLNVGYNTLTITAPIGEAGMTTGFEHTVSIHGCVGSGVGTFEIGSVSMIVELIEEA